MKIPKHHLLVIDNEDSFTFNLIQLLEQIGAKVDILSGTSDEIPDLKSYKGILFSPGPGLPEEFPLMFRILEKGLDIPVLGICLGMQAICLHFGGSLFKQERVQHGQVKKVLQTQSKSVLFNNVSNPFEVGLYHSWAADRNGLPTDLEITCYSDEGVIMGISHVHRKIEGLQFHPESFLTPAGHQMLRNWVQSTSGS